ncbi:Hypothetical predicted protein, partial [Paramuricea clavata]
MPEINGVWLNPIPQGREEIASIQKKAKRYYFAQRTVDYSSKGAVLLLAGIGLSCLVYYGYQEYCGSMYDKDIKRVNLSDSYLGKALINVGLIEQGIKNYGDWKYLDYLIISSISLIIFVFRVDPHLYKLQNYFIEKCNDCINIIEASNKSQVPDYEDMKCYDQ